MEKEEKSGNFKFRRNVRENATELLFRIVVSNIGFINNIVH